MTLTYIFKILEDGTPKIANKDKFIRELSEFKGKELEATFKLKRKKRSNNQNSFYWGNYIESQIQCFKDMWGELYSKERIHDFNKVNFFCEEKVNEDEIIKIPRSTTDLTTVEFEECLELGRTFFLNSFDWVLPYPLEQSELFENNLYPKI